jgi:uncharacterized protein (DUF2336 family)
VIAQAASQIQTDMRDRSAHYAAARSNLLALHKSGRLDEERLAGFARAGRFDETTIALSIMGDLPIGLVERAVSGQRTEQILVFAKATGLGWETTKQILMLQAGTRGSSRQELEQCGATFARLQPDTAKKAVQFYRLRERSAGNN